MDTVNEFEFKRRKYMPVFPKATGKPTTYIEGYPCEDDEHKGATGFHGEQITTFSEQLSRYFSNEHVYGKRKPLPEQKQNVGERRKLS